MKVAFWSTVHGQTTTTSNVLAISIMIALKQTLKTLITHNHYYHSTLEHTLLDANYRDPELTEFSDMGIDAVSRFIKFNTVDESCIKNYATTIINNRLDFLTGNKQA
nr:hypothetical protein [Vallitaleaceae bacterium]